MGLIQLLDSETIDKIAAGEVVERPLNVVKELVENAIDSGADIISVEIKGGGTELIRVTDNGSGIDSKEVPTAFLRHATSKLTSVNDLLSLRSMGFRGEALSSISAVSMTEMITKTNESLLGTRIVVEGGKLNEISEIGAPKGTTVIVKKLFYNTPARKKFLKTESTEGSYVEDIMEKFALSHPEISFNFTNNGKLKIQTNGSLSLKDCIYRIYGKDIWERLLSVNKSGNDISITGYIAKPEYSLSLRNDEIFFVNNRFIKSKLISQAIEEGYHGYMMQHRFPFCVLMINIDPSLVDVNVHPGKMEVRFSDNIYVSNLIRDAVKEALSKPELIPKVSLDDIKFDKEAESDISININNTIVCKDEAVPVKAVKAVKGNLENTGYKEGAYEAKIKELDRVKERLEPFETRAMEFKPKEEVYDYKQENLFEERLIDDAPLKEYQIIGQIFDTYWLITLDENLYIVDQHAAHEKVNYERFLKQYTLKEPSSSQMIMPGLTLNLSSKEADIINSNLGLFESLGFEIDEFGDSSKVIRAVPENLYGMDVEQFFKEVLYELTDKETVTTPDVILQKLASMSCKAAVKGNNKLSFEEMSQLMKELMSLENPYHCPHGRPVFISMTKQELDKKFRRIV